MLWKIPAVTVSLPILGASSSLEWSCFIRGHYVDTISHILDPKSWIRHAMNKIIFLWVVLILTSISVFPFHDQLWQSLYILWDNWQQAELWSWTCCWSTPRIYTSSVALYLTFADWKKPTYHSQPALSRNHQNSQYRFIRKSLCVLQMHSTLVVFTPAFTNSNPSPSFSRLQESISHWYSIFVKHFNTLISILQ